MKRIISIVVLIAVLFSVAAPLAFADGPKPKHNPTAGTVSNPDDNSKGPERNDNDPGRIDNDDTLYKKNGKNDNGNNEGDGDCDDNEGNKCKDKFATPEETAEDTPETVIPEDTTPEDAAPNSEVKPDDTDHTDQPQVLPTPTVTATQVVTIPVIITETHVVTLPVVVTETVVVTDVHSITETVYVTKTVEPQVGGRMVAAPIAPNCPTCCEQRTTCCPEIDYRTTIALAAVIIFCGLIINGLLRRR